MSHSHSKRHEHAASQGRLLSSADLVSLLRLPLAGAFLLLFDARAGTQLGACIGVALLAQASDHLDGYLARSLERPPLIGWLFDSLADRIFYVAALLAFVPAYGLSMPLIWLFILREVGLYALRAWLGDFEFRRPGFRRYALAHATLVRCGIAIGCIIPWEILPGTAHDQILGLGVCFAAAIAFGYFCLLLLVLPANGSLRNSGELMKPAAKIDAALR
jgi:phosphatidylglycerophosphate synthase